MKTKYQNPPLWWWLFVILGVSGIALLGFTNSFIQDSILQNRFQLLFWLIVAIHVTEAICVYFFVNRSELKPFAFRWFLQTLICGFMSILFLKKMIRQSAKLSPKLDNDATSPTEIVSFNQKT